MMARKETVRIRNKRYGSVYRIIRTKAVGSDLYWVCRDESGYVRDGHRGEIVRISVDVWATGDWEVCYPKQEAPSTENEKEN